MYITQTSNRWPTTTARVAARLRKVVDLPGLTVRTDRDMVTVSWVAGPAWGPVATEFAGRLRGVVRYRLVRLYPVAVVGAAFIDAWVPGADWDTFTAAWYDLDVTDLTVPPYGPHVLQRGAVLAGIAGAPTTALVGWHRRRWDAEMWRTLSRLGPDVLAAVTAPPHRDRG